MTLMQFQLGLKPFTQVLPQLVGLGDLVTIENMKRLSLERRVQVKL